ncbi:MAG: glycoside hydrolase family 3 N-terminal domain-containing protein [Bacteroidota bacterium]
MLSCTKTPETYHTPFTDQELGQLLVIGFRGTELDKEHPVINDLKEWNIGGVILYDYDYLTREPNRNITSPDQLLKMAGALISNSPVPPIIAVKQNGGQDSPLKHAYGFPSTKEPSYFGMHSEPDTVQKYVRNLAQEFLVVGVNTNMHPRVDLGSQTALFGNTPEMVVEAMNGILDEYDQEGIFSVPGYFPGYSPGYTSSDENDDITNQWSSDYLSPYETLIQERSIGGIMTAHSFNAQIDSIWPGTLSKKVVTGLLRDSLNFDGVIFSDDLQKPIITSKYDQETAISQAINAGIDILVLGNNFVYDEHLAEHTIRTIQKLISEGKIKPERIEASLARVKQLKDDVIAELCTCLNF